MTRRGSRAVAFATALAVLLMAPPALAQEQLGGGWTRVRHVPSGNTWHPATDRLAGTAVYGDSNDDSVAWSINFETAVPGYNQFLFSSSDGVYWLVATKWAVVGEYYQNALRDVVASSLNADAHQVRWYHRSGYLEDPWIGLSDHAVDGNYFMYGGDSRSWDDRPSV